MGWKKMLEDPKPKRTQEDEKLEPVWIPEIKVPENEKTEQVHNPKAGDRCPRCKAGKLDYDGLLNLVCQKCGYTLAGCFS